MSIHQVARIICAGEAKQRVVMLGKTIEANTRIMTPLHDTQGSLSPQIGGRTIICSYNSLVGGSQPLKCGAIKVIGRRNRQQHSRAKRVDPGKISKDVLLAFAVANAGSLQVCIVRHLKKIVA